MSFPAENIRDWRGKPVVDRKGNRIGSLEAVYVDTGTDEPSWASVEVGMVGRKRLVFVPLAGATVAPRHVKVQVDRKVARGSPSIGTDGELRAADEPTVFEHYGMTYAPGTSGERRLARR